VNDQNLLPNEGKRSVELHWKGLEPGKEEENRVQSFPFGKPHEKRRGREVNPRRWS